MWHLCGCLLRPPAAAAGVIKITHRGGYVHKNDMFGNTLGNASAELKSDIPLAKEATDQSVGWLEAQAPSKTAPSGIGVENYDWYLKNVPLALYTCAQEVALIESEPARAHAFLALEEERTNTFRNRPWLAARPNIHDSSKSLQGRSSKWIYSSLVLGTTERNPLYNSH